METALVARTLAALQAERPAFHGGDHDRRNWQLGDAVLARLAALVGPGSRTLETGCGYSTIVLAASGAEHSVVAPDAHEHQRIVEWCAAHGVSTERVRFVPARSQHVLPQLDLGPLDLVLIDGDHSFPVPFLDWYFTAEALSVGGTLVVDDIQIRTIGVLREFLRAETARWRHTEDIGTTALFEKLTTEVVDPWSWRDQPWAAPDEGSRSALGALGRRLFGR